MSAQACFNDDWRDTDGDVNDYRAQADGIPFDPDMLADLDAHQDERCDWCGSTLPDNAFKFCSRMCAAYARADSL